MISDIVYDKQLVNLVNDNIKKVSMDFNNQRIPSVYSCLLINSSRLSIHSNRFIIKTTNGGCNKIIYQKTICDAQYKTGMLGLAIIALIGVLLYVDQLS
jgi:cell division transport system permease protein